MHDHNTMLKEFIQNNEGKLKKLQDDAKIAQDAFDDAVKYFGENPKTTPPKITQKGSNKVTLLDDKQSQKSCQSL